MGKKSKRVSVKKLPNTRQEISALIEQAQRIKTLSEMARKAELECQYTQTDVWSDGLCVLLETISNEIAPLLSQLEKMELRGSKL